MPDRVISVPQATQIATKIKNKFDNINDRLHDLSLHPVKNLVPELLPLSTNQVVAGRTVKLTEVDVQRATAVIDVEGGKTYTVNQPMSNSFSGFADASNAWIGPVNDYKTEDYIFTAPANAKKLYLCNTGWTVNQGLVVLEGGTPIAGTTKTEYPFDTVVRLEPSVPIEPYSTNVGNLLTDTGFLKTQIDAQGVTFGGTIPGFSGNTSTDDPLVVTVSRIYYKTKKTTGDMYLSSDALKNLTFSVGNNNALVFDYDTLTAYVTENLSAASYPLTNKFILIWKQGQAIKGDWAWLYYRQDIRTDALDIKRSIKRVDLYDKGITGRIHSRQGEGFTYPDNSLEGIKSALKDGYPGIRIAVASTSDDVIYCTHSYELRNNKTLNLNYVTVKTTGNVYDGDVRINTVTSDFINTLQYKGYDIPTLESVLDYVCRFDIDVTLEVKDRMSVTAVQNMLNACAYSGVNPVFSCDGYSAEDFVAVKQDADFEIQLNPYSAENADTYYNLYKDSCKSLRFGFVYNGAMPTRSEVVYYHNLGVTFRLAGSNPTRAQFEDVVRWADVIEVPGDYQTWVDRLINETW